MAGAEPGHGLPAAGLPLEADDLPGRPALVQPHVPPSSRLDLTELRPDARSGRRRDLDCVLGNPTENRSRPKPGVVSALGRGAVSVGPPARGSAPRPWA